MSATELEDRAEPAPAHAARRRKRRRGPIIAVIVLLLLAARRRARGAGAAVPHDPHRGQPGAREPDRRARRAAEGNLPAAAEHVAAARADVTAAESAAHGFRAGVLAALPVAGPAVDDVRLLISALDQAVPWPRSGSTLYPSVLGEDAALLQDGTVDLTALASLPTPPTA